MSAAVCQECARWVQFRPVNVPSTSGPPASGGVIGTWITDELSTIRIMDVVDGAAPDDVMALVHLHREAFPEYDFSTAMVEADASLPPDRAGIRVHQWLVFDATIPSVAAAVGSEAGFVGARRN